MNLTKDMVKVLEEDGSLYYVIGKSSNNQWAKDKFDELISTSNSKNEQLSKYYIINNQVYFFEWIKKDSRKIAHLLFDEINNKYFLIFNTIDSSIFEIHKDQYLALKKNWEDISILEIGWIYSEETGSVEIDIEKRG